MSNEDWQAGFAKSLGVFLNGGAIPTPNERGERVVDDSFFVMFNAHHEPLEFKLPPKAWGERWTQVLDTHESADEMSEERLGRELAAGDAVTVGSWSLVLLRRIGPRISRITTDHTDHTDHTDTTDTTDHTDHTDHPSHGSHGPHGSGSV
jgi:glycogen operon protein